MMRGGISIDTLPKIGTNMTYAIHKWCEQHQVCLNWLITGELRELRDMLKRERAAAICGS
jgi:hypothetical protein